MSPRSDFGRLIRAIAATEVDVSDIGRAFAGGDLDQPVRR